ncbi:PREDICTED: peptidase inhibitor 16 [Sturnus vulgaris]|uniref:peptidase inhibitor 16 n=1 Tax=Sturnus vulgaris TaxID=9172 RepID=UPI00071A3203|nr:PREDICTED: peptidase inhibitor 16 [Sturnus vulgaris]
MDLEVAAENHAGNCSWNRNSGPTKKNLFATNSTLDVKLAIEEWNGERKFYNFSTSQCEPGKICDDYIQVIWSITNRVGCGSKFCKKVEDIKAENVQLLVCTYHPW